MRLREAGAYPGDVVGVVLRMDGSVVELERSSGGGPCGEWVERDGEPVIELTGVALDPRTTE